MHNTKNYNQRQTTTEAHKGRVARGLSLLVCLLAMGTAAQGQVTVHGSVFGGGMGADTVPTAATVAGNATVDMSSGKVMQSIYGGGEIATVGKYTYDGEQTTATYNDGGGHTEVTVSGGTVGPDEEMKMPQFTGHVFGGGKGKVDDTTTSGNPKVPALAYVHTTKVTIGGSALVKGSVYGGSENGHVSDSTLVLIEGGQIGLGRGATEAYSEWNVDKLNPTPHWAYDPNTNRPYDMYADMEGVKDNPDLDTGAVVATDGHTFYGNVFGGGSGYFPYAPGKWLRTAGRVSGNTRVVISGGHILSSVYGGNEMTDVVGGCTVEMSGGTVGVPRTDDSIKGQPVICNLYGAGKGDQRTAFNQWTNVQQTKVTVSGGRVYGSVFGGGEDGHVWGDAMTSISGTDTIGMRGTSGVDGNVFGGGRGFSATALTAGVVCGNVTLTVSGGNMLGSVYGGGRLASVGTYLVQPTADNYGDMQEGTDHGYITIDISGGTIGNRSLMEQEAYTKGTSQGDVFGGGKGMMGRQQLGLSKKTTVNMNGTTTVLGNVYGGGEIASVGWYEYADTATTYVEGITNGNVEDLNQISGEQVGNAEINISGGTVGIGIRVPGNGESKTKNDKGHVFGGCLGMSGTSYRGYSYVNDSKVTISDSALVNGSVFGGGENGHVLDSTYVIIAGGTVGMNLVDQDSVDDGGNVVLNEDGVILLTTSSDHYEHNGQGPEIYYGNVYGGGRGIDYADGVDNTFSTTAGQVMGNARVEISAGRVTHNVYGGGSLASTGVADKDNTGTATVKIDGGIIGLEQTTGMTDEDFYARAGRNAGRVFGSARGEAGSTNSTYTSMAFTGNTHVEIDGWAMVRGSVFGGGENGHVRQNTEVTINGGYIGVPLQGKEHEESTNGVGPTIYRGNVYGGGRGVNTIAGSGEDQAYSATAGRVYGNATVNINGGQIYSSVYGGGSLASVGDTIHDTIHGNWVNILDETVCAIDAEEYRFDTIGDTVKRAYRPGDPITGTGTVTINISGGIIGQTGINEGRVYGSGRGIAGEHTSQFTNMAFTNNSVVNITDNADVRGSVFGGGANGHVKQNTEVNISGGTIGSRLTIGDRVMTSGGSPKRHIYRGNVYGGGRGVDPIDNGGSRLSISAGRVYGNTTVNVSGGIVRHNIYGGGSLASVGTYKEMEYDTTGGIVTFTEYSNTEEYAGNVIHAYLQGTGKATVNISGGRIGPKAQDLFVDSAGNRIVVAGEGKTLNVNPSYPNAQDTLNANFACLGENEGSVYGSGRGVAYTNGDQNGLYTEMAFVKQTKVTVSDSAFIIGSVFGGGENGHVRFDTEVHIDGGTIGGIPLHDTTGFDLSKNGFCDSSIVVGFNIPDTVLPGTKEYKNIVELYELRTGVGKTIYRGNVYGGGRGIDHTKDGEDEDFSSSAGRVYGNANTIITDGQIYHHVYGGGSIASVGNYDTLPNGTPSNPQATTFGFEFTDTGWYKTTFADGDTVQKGLSGTVNVTMRGGRIGLTGINEGRIYCAGRGIAGENTWKITHLAYCNKTNLTIEDGDIRGSVFGGGANGHVLEDTKVEIKGGLIGWGIHDTLYDATSGWKTDSEVESLVGVDLVADMEQYEADSNGTAHTLYRGNVYGAGRGVDPASGDEGTGSGSKLSVTAGRVYGNTEVDISDGRVLHNVYGGGSLASVGDTFAISIEHPGSDGMGQFRPGTGRATVHVGGTAHIGWNGVDNNGQVYGSCRGMPASVGTGGSEDQYYRMAYVHDTKVTVSGSAAVLGSVFGGGANGHVQDSTRVHINGGVVGVDVSSMNQADITARYDYCGNVYGAGRGVDRTQGGRVSMSAGYVRGNTHVEIKGGKIYHNVYGGGSMAVVGDYGVDGNADTNQNTSQTGSTRVLVYSSVGTEGNADKGYGGNVFGSSRGRANNYDKKDGKYIDSNDYADMAYVYRTDVQLLADTAVVHGSVYGGGENGHVDRGGTLVTIKEGTVKGNVFGGGKGNPSSPTAGIVDGSTQVHIGTEEQFKTTRTNSVVVGGYVFGGNDAGGSPLDSSRVDVWVMAHSGDNTCPTIPTLDETSTYEDSAAYATLSDSNTAKDAKYYALKAVYGGGNRANVLTGDETIEGNPEHFNEKYKSQRLTVDSWPTSRATRVTIHGCSENTVQYVYGGGKAANTNTNKVTIEGGRVYRAFAGGDGSEPGTKSDVLGDASITVKGGVVYQLFGGSNTSGKVMGTARVDMEPEPTCDLVNSDIFGGGNRAIGGTSVVTIPCGTKGLKDVYGGSNEAKIEGDVTLNILGGEMERAFGGSRNADIVGNVTVNLLGGTVDTLFGGNNAGGKISGQIEVNVDWGRNSCVDPLHIGTIFGGGNEAPYSPSTDSATVTPVVNLYKATVSEDVFGGGNGTDNDDAKVTANPAVVIGAARTMDVGDSTTLATATDDTVRVKGNVYGGGNASPTMGSTTVVARGQNTTIEGNVYGGGNAAEVNEKTDVHVGYYASDEAVATPAVTIDGDKLKASCATEGAYVRYTIDGKDPAVGEIMPKEGIDKPTTGTVKLRAYRGGYEPSEIEEWSAE